MLQFDFQKYFFLWNIAFTWKKITKDRIKRGAHKIYEKMKLKKYVFPMKDRFHPKLSWRSYQWVKQEKDTKNETWSI